MTMRIHQKLKSELVGNSNTTRVCVQLLVSLVFLTCLTACSKTINKAPGIGIISAALDQNNQVLADPVALEQQSGYALAIDGSTDGNPAIIQVGEGNLQDDVQVAVRSLVEEQEAGSIIGATTNEATMKSTALVNFFNIPMIIPTADGDNLLPSNNQWVFRLSAPQSAYANYIYGSLLLPPPASSEDAPVITKAPKLAILYEDNSFGESAAVAAARDAMHLSIKITMYRSYPAGGVDESFAKVVSKAALESGAQIISLISNNTGDAKLLVKNLNQSAGSFGRPVILGQGGAFNTSDFLESDAANNIYIVRQVLDTANCPAGIVTLYEGQSYAAFYLLQQAQDQIDAANPPESMVDKIKKLLKREPETPALTTQREKMRDTLRQVKIKVPCIGPVEFDNTGQNKNIRFETVFIKNGVAGKVTEDDFRSVVDKLMKMEQ